jgi:hypothetical protein
MLFVNAIAKGRHHVASVKDHRPDAIIVCRRAAGQIFLLV